LGIWFYVVGFQEVVATFKNVALVPAIVATLIWIIAVGLRAWKWHVILLSTQQVPFGVTGRVYWGSSFLNVLFPFRVGELARSLFLKQLVDMPIAESLPTVVVDRLYSIATILLALLFLPLAPFRFNDQDAGGVMQGLRWGLGIVAAGFLATLIVLYLLRHQKTRVLRLVERLLFFLSDRWKGRLLRFVADMIDSMRFVRSDARSVLGLLAWSAAVLFADALKDHFVLQAFGLDVPLTTCFFGVCLTNLAFILPSPPGNIGSNEWYATLVYTTGFGYNRAQVAGGALFGHAMTTLVVVIGGAISLSTLGITVAEGLRISASPPAGETTEEPSRDVSRDVASDVARDISCDIAHESET
jgi:uncharacterized protein (TIRG00374 family)